MATLDRYFALIERSLCELAGSYSKHGPVRTLMAFDRERGQFILVDEGWEGPRRIHQVWAHVEVADERIWIHEDGTEKGIANLLTLAGIPHDRIVLAFYAPSLRDVTEFAS